MGALMSKLEDMEILVHVVEAGSFTRAADQLNSTKSMVSRRLSELEKRLGARLFNRTTRRLSLTEAGQTFYEHSRKIISEVEEVEESMGGNVSEPRGRLRVNAPTSFVDEISPAILEFIQRYPQLQLDLHLSDQHLDIVSEGFDLALRLGHLRDSTLVARRLAPCNFVVCASPAYIKRHGEPATPEIISQHECVVYGNLPVSEIWQFIVDGNPFVPEVNARISMNVGKAIVRAVVAGMGIGLLPTFVVSEAVRSGSLVQVLKDYKVMEHGLYVVYPSNRYVPARVRMFVDYLAERFGGGGGPYWDEPFSIPDAQKPVMIASASKVRRR